MTFQELQDEALLLVIDTPASVQTLMPRFVQRAHRDIQKKHDFQVMKAALNVTTAAATRLLVATPSNWKRYRDVPYYVEERGGIREMTWVTPEGDALTRWGANTDLGQGSPRGLNRDATSIYVYPVSDSNSDYDDGEYRIVIPYWKYLPQLTQASDTDWIADEGDTAIIYKAVSDAFFADHDETNGLLWSQRAKGEFDALVILDKEEMIANTQSLVYHTGARMPHTQE